MTKAQQKLDFAPYLKYLQRELGLSHWEIELAEESSPEGSVASVSVTPSVWHARIWLNHVFLDKTPEEQRTTIVHELLHVWFDQAHHFARDFLNEQGTRAFRSMYEQSIEGLAKSIAPKFKTRPQYEENNNQ